MRDRKGPHSKKEKHNPRASRASNNETPKGRASEKSERFRATSGMSELTNEGYRLSHQWKLSMVVASYLVSVLGAYTTTQLMCQSTSSRRLWKKLSWIGVASVSFGGTAIWAMHFVSMLAMNIGIPVQYDATATIASAVVAVIVIAIFVAQAT